MIIFFTVSVVETSSYTQYILFISEISNSLGTKALLSFYKIINAIIVYIIFIIDSFLLINLDSGFLDLYTPFHSIL